MASAGTSFLVRFQVIFPPNVRNRVRVHGHVAFFEH